MKSCQACISLKISVPLFNLPFDDDFDLCFLDSLALAAAEEEDLLDLTDFLGFSSSESLLSDDDDEEEDDDEDEAAARLALEEANSEDTGDFLDDFAGDVLTEDFPLLRAS